MTYSFGNSYFICIYFVHYRIDFLGPLELSPSEYHHFILYKQFDLVSFSPSQIPTLDPDSILNYRSQILTGVETCVSGKLPGMRHL